MGKVKRSDIRYWTDQLQETVSNLEEFRTSLYYDLTMDTKDLILIREELTKLTVQVDFLDRSVHEHENKKLTRLKKYFKR